MFIYHYKKMKKHFITLLILVLLFSLFAMLSCSHKIEKQKSQSDEIFHSKYYEDSLYINKSLTIWFPALDKSYNAFLDTAFVDDRNHFFDSFKKYFPEALKMFSTFNQIDWKYFEPDYIEYPVDYTVNLNEADRFYYTLMRPLSFYTHDLCTDFFILITEVMISKKTPSENDSTENVTKLATTVAMSYSIWDVKNSNLISADRVETTTEFKTTANKWPYRGVITKLAAELIDKLPMFSK